MSGGSSKTTLEAGDRVQPPGTGGLNAGSSRVSRSVSSAAGKAGRYGVVGSLVVAFVIFAVLRPDSFGTADNMRSMLVTAAPLAILAVGVTVVLALNEFDLSFSAVISLSSAVAVILIARTGVPWPLAIVLVVAIAVLVGIVNGLLIAYAKTPSFISTLAVGTVLTGIEFALTNQQTIFEPLPDAFRALGIGEPFWGINAQVLIALGMALIAWVMLDFTELGRFVYAIGSNREVSRLSGLRVRLIILLGFVVVAIGAAVVGTLISASSGSYTPNTGVSYLLPAYASAFLGAAASRHGRFNVPGTLVGVMLLGVLQTGLTMLQFSSAVVNIVQGTILCVTVLLSRLDKG